MITKEYLLCLAGALIAGMLMLAVCLKARGLKPLMAMLAIPVCAGLGVGGAWLLYKSLMFMMPVAAFPYSFVGGALGVVLGIVLLARILRQPVWKTLDAAAAPLCLMICVARIGEMFVKNIGWGSMLDEGSWLCRQPFAVPLEWYEGYVEWYAAIFVLEAFLAAIALGVCLSAFSGKRTAVGTAFERTVYLLAVMQIPCEQLRSMPMAWGFVRAEQILCAIIAALVLGRSCWLYAKQSHAGFVKAWWPVIGILLCAGAVMTAEFMFDGKIDTPLEVSWSLFMGALVVMLALESYAVRRRMKKAA